MNIREGDTPPAQLAEYLRNAFLPKAAEPLPRVPLPDESHVVSWREWLAGGEVTPERLAQRLPHLRFGVGEGLSKSAQYRAGILSGDSSALPESSFDPVGSIDVSIEAHWAGHLPVIRVTERADFEYMFAALANRCEPIDISPQVHASMIAGLVSPVRLAEAHRAWEEGSLQADPLVANCTSWPEAMKSLDEVDRTRFRDRFLIMHEVEYAGLRAEDVDGSLDADEWVRRSRMIRMEHEFTHYATRRLFDSMRLNLHDEIIADCMGFLAAFGRFDSSLFLNGLGIDRSLQPTPDGRVWMYVSDIDKSQVPEVCALAAAAAQTVEVVLEEADVSQRPDLVKSLASVSLQALGGSNGRQRLLSILEA